MTDKPTDPGTEEEVELSHEVQDYLDMLLCPAASEPETDENVEAEAEQQRPPVQVKGTPALTMVGGTAVHSSRPQPLPRHAEPEADNPRPFAEPAKPVTLRMPVVEVKPETVTKTEPAPTKVEAPPEVKPATETAEAPAPAPSQVPVETPPAPAPETTPESTPEPAAEAGETVAAETGQQPHQTSQWLENGRPAWAQGRFECLLFSVGGLTLAVPLVELGTIYPINDEITPIFGQIDWFMGLLSVKDRNIKTVNTAKVVMPERYTDNMKERYAYVITINGVEWGLAVDTVSNAITLDPSDVRWRGERSKRPWLAGTVVDHMCALLDVSQLAAMFIEANQRRKPH